jgi:hypothetical protein
MKICQTPAVPSCHYWLHCQYPSAVHFFSFSSLSSSSSSVSAVCCLLSLLSAPQTLLLCPNTCRAVSRAITLASLLPLSASTLSSVQTPAVLPPRATTVAALSPLSAVHILLCPNTCCAVSPCHHSGCSVTSFSCPHAPLSKHLLCCLPVPPQWLLCRLFQLSTCSSVQTPAVLSPRATTGATLLPFSAVHMLLCLNTCCAVFSCHGYTVHTVNTLCAVSCSTDHFPLSKSLMCCLHVPSSWLHCPHCQHTLCCFMVH